MISGNCLHGRYSALLPHAFSYKFIQPSPFFRITKAFKEKRKHKPLKSKEDSGNHLSKLVPTTVHDIKAMYFNS